MADRFTLIYLGLPLGALALLRDGLDVGVACVSRTNVPGMRRLRRAMAARGGLLLARPDLARAEVVEVLGSVRPSLLVSWFWTRRIPAPVLGLAPGFNVHPSLLPRHRGADPYFWTLARRDSETGVTAHALTPQYDDGPIIAQRSMAVPPSGNSLALARALDRPSLALMREIAGRYARGEAVPTVPQDESIATAAPTPVDDDCELLWDWTVDEVLARIRAAAPDPGAFTGYGEDTIVLLDARRARTMPAPLEPGEIVDSAEGVLICVADGAIVVGAARREDAERVHRGAAVAELFPGIPRV